MSRTIAIGDVHGCYAELEALLEKLSLEDSDRVIFLGDVINRGPDSLKVLDKIRALSDTCEVKCLMGNHELRLLAYRESGNEDVLKEEDWPTYEILRDEDWVFVENMEKLFYCEELETVFVHGGFLPGEPWREQPLEVVCTVQVVSPKGKSKYLYKYPDYPFWANLWHGPPFVVYGHTPRKRVERHAWSIGIDTSCVSGGHLTAFVLPKKEIVQVKAFKVYVEK